MKKVISIIIKTTGDLAFTYSGFAVVYATLSGETRKMATIAMVVACAVHYAHQIKEGLHAE